MSARLFVGNLPFDTTEAELREIFSPVGTILRIHFPLDRETSRPRGFAFVELEDQAAAQVAIQRFNNQLFRGRPLVVNEARARGEGGPPTRSPGGYGSSRPQGGPSRGIGAGPAAWGIDAEGERKPSRNFGPDAPPRGKKKFLKADRGERGPKGPIKERGGGRFFDVDEDDLYSGGDEPDIDNFAMAKDGEEEDGES
ncbi:MAG: RNA-binding protein [Acidobacteria bacterium]|jgi:RNA recognition motif-containing protein|nr:RNA-binding protein [Acidobacteriota bacterium]